MHRRRERNLSVDVWLVNVNAVKIFFLIWRRVEKGAKLMKAVEELKTE